MTWDITPKAWMDDALCLDVDPDFFHPEEKGGRQGAEIRKFCAPCPVRVECLEHGLRDEHGWFGGMSPLDRQRMRIARMGRKQETA